MGGLLSFLLIYIFGGLTLLPLLAVLLFLHAYLTFPVRDDTAYREAETHPLLQPGDDVQAIERAQQTLGEKFRARNSFEADVAAGYFAVCREYVPGGVNGKPPERNTPVGSTPVASPSPSVYQSMYRSLFERKPSNGPIEKKGAAPPKRGGNVFYVVLRHGHLMLFDDDEQLEVRHVISLAHHTVSIYSGEDDVPEGELFIKRNALCLSRRLDAGEVTVGGGTSKPFFLFSENCSEKEDFYFALLRNQERKPDAVDNPPIPLQYDVKDIITLVQRLHSSEEHLQTRWINAVIGRVFLALYKTTEVENYIRSKITKKISRVKTPSFLSQISLQKVDMGEAAPVITNPRLKDLTVDGELVVEADVKYSGNFRLEVAATARIELGTRFKAREVNLLLAVVLKRIEGHAFLRIKPSPSNRFWISFETMPKIELLIEPIVSSRQITYTLILRQIENRIKEVVAESLVYPNWDDSPFYQSDDNIWRGGIWANGKFPEKSVDPETLAAQQGNVDEVEKFEAEHEGPAIMLTQDDNSMSTSSLNTPPGTAYARKAAKSAVNLTSSDSTSSSSSIDSRTPLPDSSRSLRSGSLVGASSPVVSTDVTHADVFKPSTPPDTSHAMAAIAALSNSPLHTPVGSPSTRNKLGSHSSTYSRESESSDNVTTNGLTSQPSPNGSAHTISLQKPSSVPSSPASLDGAASQSDAQSTRSFASFGSLGRNSRVNTSSSGTSTPGEPKRISLAAVTSAAATAKQWGWNAIQRHADRKNDEGSEPQSPPQPRVMGRGQPLPPPGMPLPGPDKKTKTAPIPVPKRKPMPPPNLIPKQAEARDPAKEARTNHPLPPPILPKRRSKEEASEVIDDGLMVVSAPMGDSEPTTPLREDGPSYIQPWVEDAEDSGSDRQQPVSSTVQEVKSAPKLPKRRPPHRVLSSSPEEDGHKLPSWMAAQEEEARAKTTFVDEDSGPQ